MGLTAPSCVMLLSAFQDRKQVPLFLCVNDTNIAWNRWGIEVENGHLPVRVLAYRCILCVPASLREAFFLDTNFFLTPTLVTLLQQLHKLRLHRTCPNAVAFLLRVQEVGHDLARQRAIFFQKFLTDVEEVNHFSVG